MEGERWRWLLLVLPKHFRWMKCGKRQKQECNQSRAASKPSLSTPGGGLVLIYTNKSSVFVSLQEHTGILYKVSGVVSDREDTLKALLSARR